MILENFTEKGFWIFCLILNNSGQITFSLLLFYKLVWHHCYKVFGLCKRYFFDHWYFIMPASSFTITIHLNLCFWYPSQSIFWSRCNCSLWVLVQGACAVQQILLLRRVFLPLPCLKTLSKSLYLSFPVPFSSYFSAILALGKVNVSYSVWCKDTNHKCFFWWCNSNIKKPPTLSRMKVSHSFSESLGAPQLVLCSWSQKEISHWFQWERV